MFAEDATWLMDAVTIDRCDRYKHAIVSTDLLYVRLRNALVMS